MNSRVFLLTSSDGITTVLRPVDELASNHVETGTLIILHSLHSDQFADTSSIPVRSPDTDVFLLLLAFSDRF